MTDIDRHRAMGSQMPNPPIVTRIQPTEYEIRAKALELSLSYVKTGGPTYVLEVAQEFYKFLTRTETQDVISPR